MRVWSALAPIAEVGVTSWPRTARSSWQCADAIWLYLAQNWAAGAGPSQGSQTVLGQWTSPTTAHKVSERRPSSFIGQAGFLPCGRMSVVLCVSGTAPSLIAVE